MCFIVIFNQKIYPFSDGFASKMKIFVINNYGQFNHLIQRAIRDKVETSLISNHIPPEEIDADGLILGGGPSLDKTGQCADYLRKLDIPILGICLGLQLMAITFSGNVAPGTIGGYAEVEIEVVTENDILKGFPKTFKTWASHADQVSEIPVSFEILACSKICEIEAMRHSTKPLYGVQWHPEVVHTEYGQELLENFIRICRK